MHRCISGTNSGVFGSSIIHSNSKLEKETKTFSNKQINTEILDERSLTQKNTYFSIIYIKFKTNQIILFSHTFLGRVTIKKCKELSHKSQDSSYLYEVLIGKGMCQALLRGKGGSV